MTDRIIENPFQCRALNVSDEKQCLEVATSVNGLFCSFHSKQCQGLYRGYKSRNAKLDRLDANPPKYLAESKIPLANQTFEDLDSPETCKEVHAHLFLKFQLLERVIRARKLHHSRFFSQDMDYGHAKFLDSLQGQKASTLKALERLERRTAEVLYKKNKWFSWVRECQDEEEKTRDKEQKKVKQEAAMFRRHWRATEMRLRDMKQKEQKLRSEAYLEKVYKERLAEQEKNGEQEEEDDETDWDPIEDVLEDNRASYVDLIESFLWMLSLEEEAAKMDVVPESQDPPPATETVTPVLKEAGPKLNSQVPANIKPSHSSKKAKAKSKPKPKKKVVAEKAEEPVEPDKSLIETQQEMYDRLKNGVDFSTDKIKGIMVAGTLENPVITSKTVTFPEEDIQRILAEVSEIKHLLFCRLLLGHAALLPAALRANSVKEFLADLEVTGAALRDLCLKMENPGLQEIRDACADLFRTEDEADDDDNPMATSEASEKDDAEIHEEEKDDMMILKPKKRKGELPDEWIPKRERNKQMAEQMGRMPTLDNMLQTGEGTAVDFGDIKHATPKEKIMVKICGRSIWNYPSNKAMSRGGWLHFCIIAKDSTLHEAVGLCRHWDEFFELNILAVWHYFPGANWAEWVGNRYRQQMLSLGFILYFETAEPDAMALQAANQNNNRRTRRAFGAFEARNFMCAHIKRDDQASRRLVQYLAMQSHRILVLVRDAETGKLVIKPPEEQRWLYREKGATGRGAREWNIIKAVGPQFFDEMEKHRSWRFSFKEYYDVYVWDLAPGECFPALYNCVQEMLFKALRVQTAADIYRPAAPVLKTLCRNPETDRVRDIKPGEQIESIYDTVTDSRTRFYYGPLTREGFGDNPSQFPRHLFYGEADRREDEILFPEEKSTGNVEVGKIEPLRKWEEEGFSMRKFVEGWNSDYSDLDEDEVWTDEDDDEEVGSDEDDDDEMDVDHENAPSKTTKTSNSTEPSPEILIRALQKLNVDKDLKQVMIKLARKDKPKPKDPGDPKVMQEDFMTFLDKEKSRIFKKVWHKADLEPNAQEHYAEMMQMSKQSRIFNHRKMVRSTLTLRLIDVLDVDLGDLKDLHKAVAKISPFFHPEFLAWKEGKPFKDSLLFKQEERAKILPASRKHFSNKMRPDDFFSEFDEVMKDMSDSDDLEALPEKWDIAIRPIIARLYKAGVIRTREDVYHEGQAFAAKEPGSDEYDLFIDWRQNIETIQMGPDLKNPYLVEPFVKTARKFAQKHPNARFSVLCLWSAPHFWPLMIGYDNHDPTSFRDLIGRSWIWMFVPKDMPCSEWSIHHSARQRLAPFAKFFRDKVVLKRDKFLVMGTNEDDLEKYTAALTFAIQMRPWRWEVDLWKSFVNVEVGFLEGLDGEWLE